MIDPDDLKRKLIDAGLELAAERIVKLARPCYRIERTLVPDERIPIGASKFGGSPDLPAGFAWPHTSSTKEAEVMEFVGQVRLADLPEPRPVPFPPDGLLSFFNRWSDGRVYYYPEGMVLQRTAPPPQLTPPAPVGVWARLSRKLRRGAELPQAYRACSLRAVPALSLPDGGSSLMKELNLKAGDLETYFEFCAGRVANPQPSETTQHQMFGYSTPVQNEMELECDAIRRGDEMRWDAPSQRYIAAMQDWIVLFQLDTDDYTEGPGWMWGDAGLLYFWIHRDDLAALDFNKVVTIQQCH